MPALTDTSTAAPFVTLKPGSREHPIFIVHGLCGRSQFSKLAAHIGTTNSVLGIQARGIDGLEQPYDRIEDMSEFYLEALKTSYPDGPYILIGYSFGGLIALEMARRLLQNGIGVPLLILVDTYPHPRFLTPTQRTRVFLRRLRSHRDKMAQLPGPYAFSYFIQRFKNRLGISAGSFEGLAAEDGRNLALDLVTRSAYDALANYKPKFYPGKINFVTTNEKTFFPEDPEPVWAHLADKLEVDVVPGNHLNIVTTEFEPLAAVITRLVRGLE
jgi:acetoacetyl-CoA synthetase